MNLVIDFGNTNAKVGIFNQHQLIEKHTFSSVELLTNFTKSITVDSCIISSVNANADQILEYVNVQSKKLILTYTLPLPITIHYSTPHTLGVDRIAGACGAQKIFPNENTLVIDAGTCITYDLTNKDGNYFGGGISPGLRMRFEALHTFTAKLPLITPINHPALIGNSTEGSMQSGVVNGLLVEIEGIIRLYKEKYPDLRVILCGGDSQFFENMLKATIFASPDLVLIGLNSILIHNVRY